MNLDSERYEPGFLDKIFLFRKKIIAAHRITKNSVLFVCDNNHVYLKFSYPGNIQYHKIPYEDLDRVIGHLRDAKAILDGERA